MNLRKKLIYIVLMIMFISMCSGCGKKIDKSKGIFVTKWNNFYEGDNVQFYYERPENLSLQMLNTKYKVSEVVKDCKDDFEKAVKIMNWLSSNMKFSKSAVTTKDNGLDILKLGMAGNALSDKDFVIAYSQAAASVGLYVRKGEFKAKDNQHLTKNSYYKVCEVWSDKYNKWVMMDVSYNGYLESEGKPLSAIEALKSGFKNVKLNGIKDGNKYIKNFNNYAYSYTIYVDNNISGKPKSNSYVTYLTSNDMPEIRTQGDKVFPTIFVKKDDLFNVSPKIEYKDNKSDKIPTLIFSKKTEKEGDKIGDKHFYGAVFQNSSMVEDYFISVNNSPFGKVNGYFDFPLQEGENIIKLSQDKKNIVREVVLQYKK